MATNSVKPPESMKIERGNPSHSWSLWKRKFDIYLRATGSSTEPDEKKVGLLLNHIGEEGLDIYDTFTFLPARPNPIQGQPALPMEDPNHYETVLEKYADYFGRRDPQLMLREKFWFHLKREPSQTLESWVLAIKKLATECKFPATYMNQAVRDKLTFFVYGRGRKIETLRCWFRLDVRQGNRNSVPKGDDKVRTPRV